MVKEASENRPKTRDELRVEAAQAAKPPLSRVLSLRDMEVRAYVQFSCCDSLNTICHQDVARQVLSYKALAYYSSAADDELSTHATRYAQRAVSK